MSYRELTDDDYYDALCYADDVYEEKECETCCVCLDNNDSKCFKCWHLCNLGFVKLQIELWLTNGDDAEKIIETLKHGGWFRNMTNSTVERLKRAVINKAE